MKSSFATLTKRELKKAFSLKKFNVKRFDFLGGLLTLFIIFALGAAYVLVLKGLIANYAEIFYKEGPRALPAAQQIISRQVELMTISYTVIMAIGVLFGVSAINKSITYDKDTENLLRLPVTTQEIFLSKLVTLYISQMAMMSVLIIPVNVTFYLTIPQGAWFWVATAITCILLPAIPFLIASLLSVPFKYLTNWLKNKYLLLAVLFVLLLGGAFWLYSKLLVYIEDLFVSERIKIIFNKESLNVIIGISNASYPARLFANMIFEQKVLLNLGLALLSTLAAAGLVYLFTLKLFNNYIMQGAKIKRAFNKQRQAKLRSPFAALLGKELITVIRTPDYAFSYFATALTTPLMVYCCVQILNQLVVRLIGYSFLFEISLLCITMFAVLTNTFCAGNVSRDGEMFLTNKSLPTSCYQYVGAKILFCFITSALSVLLSCAVLALVGYITFTQATISALAALLIVTGEIMIATRRDLAHPKFDLSANPDANSKTVSFIIALGLLVSIVIGVAAIGLSVYLSVLKKMPTAKVITLQYLAVTAVSVIVFAVSTCSLFMGLEKKINKTVS